MIKKSWFVTKKNEHLLVFGLERKPSVKDVEKVFPCVSGIYYLNYTKDELVNDLNKNHQEGFKFIEVSS